MSESPISKNFIEVTLPVVYFADNTVIIYDTLIVLQEILMVQMQLE